MANEPKPQMVRIVAFVAASALLGAVFAGSGVAQERRGHVDGGFRGHEVEHWRPGDIRRFHETLAPPGT